MKLLSMINPNCLKNQLIGFSNSTWIPIDLLILVGMY